MFGFVIITNTLLLKNEATNLTGFPSSFAKISLVESPIPNVTFLDTTLFIISLFLFSNNSTSSPTSL